MIHQVLLRKAVEHRDPILKEFVETVAPKILERFVTIAALGGSTARIFPDDPCLPEGIARYSPEEFERFSGGFDQSMTTHILNGIFGGYRIAELLPPEKALNNIEKRLWLLGYVAHDYTKVFGIKLRAGELDKIRQVVRCLAKVLDYEKFLPNWEDYLDDIVFLAQNTQKVEEANLNLRDFKLKTDIRRLEILRLLSSYADILVHVKSPSEVQIRSADGRDTAYNLTKTLSDLFSKDHTPRLAYHKLADVRGLLSNLVHNVVVRELERQGYAPYLFFPNGVVYLADHWMMAKVDPQSVADRVWDQVLDIASSSENFGIKPWTTGLLVSSALYEMAGLRGVLQASRRRVIRLTSNTAPARLYGFFTGQSENDLKTAFGDDMERVRAEQEAFVQTRGVPADERIHKLGEFLAVTYRTVRDKFKKAPDIQPLLLDALGLQWHFKEIQPEGGRRRGQAKGVCLMEAGQPVEGFWEKGGVYFGWFYAAARYVQSHPGLDDAGVEDVMRDISEHVLSWVQASKLEAKAARGIDKAVKDYVARQLEIDGQKPVEGNDPNWIFEQELNQYMTAKAERKQQCSLCSSPYEAVGQEATEVPFINQQYSNKNPLDVAMLIRGVCPVCRIEMILRLVQQKGLSERRKPIHLYFYPTYFFTPETAAVVRLFIDRLTDINFWALRKHLRKEGFDYRSFLHFAAFTVEEGEEPKTLTLLKPKYSERDFAGFFFFSTLTLGKNPTDTDSWAIPTLLALGASITLNVKVVATPSFVPIYSSGADFRETITLDAPHQFARHILGKDRFRVDEVDRYLIKLLELYDLHLDVFGKEGDPNWSQINAVAKDVVTDPYYVFSYYERKERSKRAGKKKVDGEGKESKGISPFDLKRYLEIYQALGGDEKMGIIGEIVDAYANFYRAEDFRSVYGIVKPLSLAVDVTVKSDPKTCAKDLELLIAGPISDLMDRIRADPKQADGFDPIWTDKSIGEPVERVKKSRQAILDFAGLFLDRVFNNYCSGSRATLRERANLLRSAAHFYYLDTYGYRSKESKDTEKEANHE